MNIQESMVISSWNDTYRAYPLDKCLQQLIEAQVERSPDAVAVRFEGLDVCYRELNRRANRLAYELRSLGVGPDSLVGVKMERSTELMVGLLAILKAGGAYLPLDPGYPEERLALIIEDAAVKVILTQQRFLPGLDDHGCATICLDDVERGAFAAEESNPQPVNSPDDLAYVIYTSGSTGRPKGCMLPHRAICNRLLWMGRHYDVGPQDRILQKTPFTFDVSVWELFLPLLSGACLVMARPEGHKDAHYLVETMQAEGVTICHFVPSMLRFFLKHPAVSQCRSLTKVFVSGEALTHDLLLQFRRHLDAELHNLYGPTEAAVDVTYWQCAPRADGIVPIGRPIDNIQIHILDEESRPVPIGDVGELCIGGVALARGYLNRPELTAEKFVPDPFSDDAAARLYRTGDQARFLENGEIELLGRFDSQVKLRGFRIELGEIENTLRSHPRIDDAVVLVKDPGSEDPKLAAFVVATGLGKKAVRDFVRSRLPEYMAPNLVAFVERIPVTAHGKADRKALLDGAGAPASALEAGPTRQSVSEWLSRHFREALGVAELSAADDLFDHGATSFTLVQAVHSIQQAFRVTLPVDVFLEQPTITAVAAHVLAAMGGEEEIAESGLMREIGLEEAPIPLEPVRFDPRAYRRGGGAPADLERLGRLLSLLREVQLDGKGKYLYSSAGGLNAVQCYLYAAEGRIPGLPGGVYYHHPRLNRLLPVSVPAVLAAEAFPPVLRETLAAAGFALFLIAEMDAIAPIYNDAAPALVALEAGYIEQMLLSRQTELGLTLGPASGVDFAALAEPFHLRPSHRFLRCLIEGEVPAGLNLENMSVCFADFLSERNNGFSLPGEEEMAKLHHEQRQIRHDLSASGDGAIALPEAPISGDALRLRAAKRQYWDGPLSFGQLSRLLSLLRQDGEGRSLHGTEGGAEIKVYLSLAEQGVLWEEQSRYLSAGIYRYDAGRHSLRRVGDADMAALNAGYNPFNRRHAQQSRLRIFLISSGSPAPGAASRYFGLLRAGRMGQLLLERQGEFGVGLCPIGAMNLDRLRGAFGLDDGDELAHSLVGGAVEQWLPADWPRLEIDGEIGASRFFGGDGPLAIVGISGRFPGAADVDELWRNLSAGRSSIREISSEALLRDSLSGEGPGRWMAGELADKHLFDPLLFKITPAEAKTLDPQERLFLQTVWHCLENSGYTAESLASQAGRIGVFVGAMWGDYQRHSPAGCESRATSFLSAIANRVSFFNDFDGPSVVFDTSCSSAMTALHFACNSIRQGECRAAVVGGVSLISHPAHLELLAALQLLSGDGQAHPFGRDADGWVPGEGIGALLIRPLADAERDGDRVLGIIRATSVSHGGRTFRYGAPNADSQAQSIRQTLEQAGLAAEDIGYVEAAAPGASLADGAEFAALARVFGERSVDAPLLVGSIKGNIGHLESASALSQIAKVLQQLRYGSIAPTLGCAPLSPVLPLSGGRLAVADSLREWSGPRRALINAFGASGSGGHLILEAPPRRARAAAYAGPWLFPFSAASREQLDALTSAFADDLRAGKLDGESEGDISYTLCVGRVALGHRLAIVASSREELLGVLGGDGESRGKAWRGCVTGSSRPNHCEEDLRGLDRQALSAIAARWTAGESDLGRIARHGHLRIELASYPFATVDCHIAAENASESAEPPIADDSLSRALQNYLRRHFSRVSAIAESDIDCGETFERYGLTSLMITTLNRDLSQDFGELPATLLFEHQSIAALANYFVSAHAETSRQLLGIRLSPFRPTGTPVATARQGAPRSGRNDEPIAIIGLAGRFPGAEDLEAFWDNLRNGVDSIGEIPAERWEHGRYYSRDRAQTGKIHTRWGGFIDDMDRFDPLFFNISPRDAERMDPQERIFLETAWHALEDAGYDRAGLRSHYQGEVGVFVGVMHGEYLLYTRSAAVDCEDDAVDASFGSIANRVSHVLDCNGPSMAVDTICSSSLTAVHLAVESLRRGECRLAFAGGVNLSLHPNKYFIQSQLTMSSSDGRCRSFGEGGDGFVPGEGVGAVLLKPLSRAEADGDHIYGVIRATTVNHNGKTHGYTVPSPNAQAAMIAASLDKAGMDPRELSYIEAHGTGTALGDPIEIAGLIQGFARRSAALGAEAAPTGQCAVGSVKSNIGHLESAAGVAGIAKVLLQLRHGQLVPSLHSARLNPGIAFADSPFYVPQRLKPWQRPMLSLDGSLREYPRAASVSSFGSGGANGHVVIVEHQPPARESEQEGGAVLIPLSARTSGQLRQVAERLLRFLQRLMAASQTLRLSDLAFTLQRGREAMEHRLAFRAESIDELKARLAQAIERLAAQPEPSGCFDDIHFGRAKDNKSAMAVLAGDEDMAATLAAWAGKGKQHKLLELWVKGLPLDWGALGEQAADSQRISLPGYPFARERIWVSGESHYCGQNGKMGGEQLHPLLHANVSNLSRQKFASVFHGGEGFLRDHQVRGRRVLPGAAYLEMAGEAVRLSLDKKSDGSFHLRNVVWSQPLALEAGSAEPLEVETRIDSLGDGKLAFEIAAREGDAACCQGEVWLQESETAEPEPLAALQAAITSAMAADDLYRLFDGVGIHYGRWHRVVRELRVADGEVLARIALPAPPSGGQRFTWHPSLLDGALQTTLAALVAENMASCRTWVPFAMESLTAAGELGEEVWAWTRRAPEGTDAEQPAFDIDIYNRQGAHCAALRGFSLRAMKQGLLEPGDAPGCHHCLAERWLRCEPAASPLPAGRLLLISNDLRDSHQLAERYPQAAQLSLTGKESIAELANRLRETDPVDHLLWLAPALPERDCDLDGMIRAQQGGVLACFRLVKALQALEWDQRSLEWTVITRGALTVSGAADSGYCALTDPTAPAHASVHGLVGAMAKEYRHWRIRAADLPADGSWPERDPLTLPADPAGNALAYRNGVWHRQHLATILPGAPDEASSLYRDSGVYLVVGGAGGIGRVWTEHLIRTRRAQVVWLGRRERNAEIDAAIAELAKLGPAPRYIRADASSHAELSRAAEETIAAFGAIHGVAHAAIQLQDSGLARMDESRFAAGLSAKVDVCVRLAEVFGRQPLDFMLFFSSLQSATKSAGQSNYAAGCVFKNAFAHYLSQRLDYPVKVVNWGYWGEVGSVAGDDYRRRMDKLGLASIDGEQAMAALQTLLSQPLSQLGFLRASQQLGDAFTELPLPAHPDGPLGEHGAILQADYPSTLSNGRQGQTDGSAVRTEVARIAASREALDTLQANLLCAQLRLLGCFDGGPASLEEIRLRGGLLPMYGRWLAKSLDELARRGHLSVAGDGRSRVYRADGSRQQTLDALWAQWDAGKPSWQAEPALQAEARLAEAMLRVLPEVLDGRMPATDIMFPDASMSMVEGIYKRNPVSDFFNETMLEAMLAFVRERLAQTPGAVIRILEIGAGTGGTSARAFDKLKPYCDRIAEYCYTDVSQAFLLHARESYGPIAPYLNCRLFDVGRPLAEQGIGAGAYDLVIATNVLHATPDIRRTLRNAKAALKRNGLLLINEISGNSLFTHLTFGLLKGWWLFDDEALRLPGGPALSPEQWKRALEDEGFRRIRYPALSCHDLGQQIVIAESDGVIWQEGHSGPAPARPVRPVAAVRSAARADAPAGGEAMPASGLKERTLDHLRSTVGGLFKIRPDEIDAREPLETYGIDSILVVQLTNLLRGQGLSVGSALFFECRTLDALADHFVATQAERLAAALGDGSARPAHPARVEAASVAVRPAGGRLDTKPAERAAPARDNMDVAIIGMAGRYAGADNVDELWLRLREGENCISEVPADRWDWRRYFDPEPGKAGRIYTRWGGFIREIDKFDPLFFHISPREAEKMDPQERLFLEEAYQCIADAGYTPARLGASSRVGVFVGVMNGTYARQSSYWSIANRVSYQFDFQGPSLAADTACSSSLTAIHLAMESLRGGASDCALVGGVNLVVNPVHYLGLTEMKMLSPGRECRAFGAGADGFVDGEGVGALLLKPLVRAEADGDRIYGVIKGSMINAGGKTNGYTVPNPLAQSRLVTDALAAAGIDAASVGYVEAHGTGTALGDPIEIAGLERAFRDAGRAVAQRCAIGSIKPNIGHCESAAGIAGVTKVLLQLKHRQLAPSLHAETANPEIDFSAGPFAVQQALTAWQPALHAGKRVALVSSFGAGGANACVVIEEYADVRQRVQSAVDERRPAIIPLSAKTEAQLADVAGLLLDRLERENWDNAELPALACTLQTGREAMEWRLGFLAASMDGLKRSLRDFVDDPSSARHLRGRLSAARRVQLSHAGENGGTPFADWMAAGRHESLLKAWLDGREVDWRLLYQDGRPRPLSLPGYPFARERYWRPQAEPPMEAAAAHPLLHRNVSDLRGLRYVSRFSGRENVLSQHIVDGRCMMPGAAMVAMMDAALDQAYGADSSDGRLPRLRNLAWTRPFIAGDGNRGELFLELEASLEEECRLGIYSYDSEGLPLLHCRAQAGRAEPSPMTLDFPHATAHPVDVNACYRRFVEMGIEYGPDFRGICSLQRAGDQALARVRLKNQADGEGLAVPPVLLDVAMQGCMALLFDERDARPTLLVPESIGEFARFGDLPSTLQAWIRRTEDAHCFDLALFDEDGGCRALIRRLSFKPLPRGKSPGGGLLCRRQWRDAVTPEAAGRLPESLLTLTLGSHPAFAGLLERLNGPGVDCIALGDVDYSQAAWMLAERIRPLLVSGHARVVQLVVPQDDAQAYRGLGGLLFSASREQPALICQLAEIAPGVEAEPLARQLQADAAAAMENHLRYLPAAGGVRRQRLAWLHGPLAGGAHPWRADGAYLIAGGLGGVGMAIARAILDAAPRARLLLCGRSAADAPDVAGKLAALGGRGLYRQTDLSDEAQARQLIEYAIEVFGGLHGIVHCAGITRDALLASKTRADFDAVLAAKADAARYLDRASAALKLDLFVLCSSVASVLGNAGQCDYAAANGYLDAFAGIRNRLAAEGARHGRAVAINWPLWRDGGMRMSEAAQGALAARTGIEAMDSETGIQALYQALVDGSEQSMVLAGNAEKLAAMLDGGAAPAAEPFDEGDLLSYLRGLLADTVKIAASRLDDDEPFEKYGIDSLMIMDMTSALEKRFGPLSKTLFFEYPSLRRLAGHLSSALPRKRVLETTDPLAELRRMLADALGLAPADIDDARGFEQYGLDSLAIMALTCRLEKRFGPLPGALLYECASLNDLAAYLAKPPEAEPPAAGQAAQRQRLFGRAALTPAGAAGNDIAIVGLAGRYPEADDVEAFWRNLSQGRDSVGEIPPERWDWREYYSEHRGESGVHNSKWGGFIDGVDRFDPLFFNISPLEAERIDPQERLFLQTAWNAMEDAGYGRRQEEDRRRTGVYVGVMYSEYQLFGAEASMRGQRMGFAGSNASIANRVSFCLNLRGPSMAVDSMCSGSLTAIHLACQDLRGGRVSMAIAGGVNLTLHPNKYLMLSDGQFISTQGHCASFGEGGDGYVPGEGVGAVVLKRLEDAERDGDRIYGVIKGSSLNHGGRSAGYSAPNPNAQQEAIRAALDDAGVAPDAIGYVEAHGTGTKLGDPIEIAGLTDAFGERPAGCACWIGSVKANIGHCEAAAGIAGVTKVLMQLRHGQIAPSLHSGTLNPFIDFAATPFEVNQELRAWPRPERDGQPVPRMAGISSFGAGGSNGHLIVAEYLGSPMRDIESRRPEMIVLSAREPERLDRVVGRLLERLAKPQPGDSLAAIAYTLQVGREAMEHRAACVVDGLDALRDALRRFAGGDRRGWICGEAIAAGERIERFKSAPGAPWRERLANLLSSGELKTVLELWSQGLAVDWETLRSAGDRRRVSLPGYPFAEERYWAPLGARRLPVAAEPLHPLLHRNRSSFNRQRFSADFNGDEPWLRDHKVGGRKVLPGAACLEIIRAAAAQSLDAAGAVAITGLNWLAPFTVEAAPRRLDVELTLEGGRIAIVLSGDDGTTRYCQAWAEALPADDLERLALDDWLGRDWALQLDGGQVYRLFERMGIEYGSSHRGIRLLRAAQSGDRRLALAELSLEAEARADAAGCWLEPGMADSALQAAIAMLLPLDGSPLESAGWMPFELRRLDIFAPGAGRMWALLSCPAEGPQAGIDIELRDEQGNVCARFQGLRSRSSPETKAAEWEPEEELLLAPVWEAVADAAEPRPAARVPALVFGAYGARRQAAAALYPGAELAPECSEAADFLAALSGNRELDEVVWLAPPEADMGAADPELLAAQRRSAIGLFRLVKALLSQGHGRRSLRLTMVTQSAVSVLAGEVCRPAHAAVHGLAGSLAKEYPHWAVRVADMDGERLERLAQAPFDAVPSGEALAWRQGGWRRRQLARLDAAEPAAAGQGCREGGVYLVIGGAGGIGEVWSRHVISKHRARVVLLGRRPLEGELRIRLDALAAFSLRNGAPAPVYLQADAADERQLDTARRAAIERFGRIDGVVHSALALRDGSLANMDERAFTDVLDAKAATCAALARVFSDSAASLDFVLFFSSMMSFSTAAGQANYAAGCAFADAFADRLRHDWPCRVKVINWGYWGGVGSVSGPRYRERMAALGLGSIEPEEGMRALERLLDGELDQLALLKVRRGGQADGLDTLASLLSDESIRIHRDARPDMDALAERLAARLAALTPPQYVTRIETNNDGRSGRREEVEIC
ncbi:amino acid adenylation domain-containing protein [Chromobacterium violaceum]|uniref:amino acid adenylation domain-containing protein n=1 Tax=Chromobacterium violaceum TaxID=536 RepID=UPI0005D32B90|nr:amino acid adenylation domain-containing protein [Chromobacterium violaceum]KJH66469.1 polyketide synthase [Chromobacterium violaceum]